jgi:hypothetical protein
LIPALLAKTPTFPVVCFWRQATYSLNVLLIDEISPNFSPCGVLHRRCAHSFSAGPSGKFPSRGTSIKVGIDHKPQDIWTDRKVRANRCQTRIGQDRDRPDLLWLLRCQQNISRRRLKRYRRRHCEIQDRAQSSQSTQDAIASRKEEER